MNIRLGNGNGTFQALSSFSAGDNTFDVAIGDLNADGKLDVISADGLSNTVSVLFGNGNGSFKARTSYLSPGVYSVALGDLNSDGSLDIVSGNFANFTTSIYLNNGNGSFKARTSYTAGVARDVALGDLNGDNALDIVATQATTSNVGVFIGNTTTSSAGTPISFLTQASSLAALTTLTSVQTSIENELANIGSIQSRLGTALTNLQQTRENYNAAESRIVDVDVALESAELVKRQILQDTSSAILAQANQEPALLLSLLKNP